MIGSQMLFRNRRVIRVLDVSTGFFERPIVRYAICANMAEEAIMGYVQKV